MGVGLEFLPKMADVNAEVLHVIGGVGSPDFPQEPPMGQHPTQVPK